VWKNAFEPMPSKDSKRAETPSGIICWLLFKRVAFFLSCGPRSALLGHTLLRASDLRHGPFQGDHRKVGGESLLDVGVISRCMTSGCHGDNSAWFQWLLTCSTPFLDPTSTSKRQVACRKKLGQAPLSHNRQAGVRRPAPGRLVKMRNSKA
jgi:hypothetical protein